MWFQPRKACEKLRKTLERLINFLKSSLLNHVLVYREIDIQYKIYFQRRHVKKHKMVAFKKLK